MLAKLRESSDLGLAGQNGCLCLGHILHLPSQAFLHHPIQDLELGAPLLPFIQRLQDASQLLLEPKKLDPKVFPLPFGILCKSEDCV